MSGKINNRRPFISSRRLSHNQLPVGLSLFKNFAQRGGMIGHIASHLFEFKPDTEFLNEKFPVKQGTFSAIVSLGSDQGFIVEAVCVNADVASANGDCMCYLKENIKLSFVRKGRPRKEVYIRFADIEKISIRMNAVGKGCLILETTITDHKLVVFHSEDAKFLCQLYYSLELLQHMADVRESLVRTSDEIINKGCRLTLIEFRTRISAMTRVLTLWADGRLNRYDITPMIYSLLRRWLSVRSAVICKDWTITEFERVYDFSDEVLFSQMLRNLTAIDHYPCAEIYDFIDELFGYWKYASQKSINGFLFNFFKNNLTHLDDIRESVQMPNVVATTMFRLINTVGRLDGLNRFLKKTLESSAATQKDLAPMNIAIVCLMGLTSLYLDNDSDSNFAIYCIIDGARFKRELNQMDELDFQKQEPMPIPAEEMDLAAGSATSPEEEDAGSPFDILVESCGDLNWLKFGDFLNKPPAGMLTSPELENQKRRDLLTCMYFYALDTAQVSRREKVFIGRILNAFPFYESALKDLVFRTCFAKVAGKHDIWIDLPHVSCDGEQPATTVDQDEASPVDREFTIRKCIQRRLDTEKSIDKLLDQITKENR